MAIDPAALDPEVLLPNVTHLRKQGSQAVAEVQQLMQGQQVRGTLCVCVCGGGGGRAGRCCAGIACGSARIAFVALCIECLAWPLAVHQELLQTQQLVPASSSWSWRAAGC